MDRLLCFLIYLLTALARITRPLSKLGIGSYDEYCPGKKLKILLAGYNGARNTGSDVRVAAIAGQLKALFGDGNIQITVMTLDKSTMAGYFDQDVNLLEFSSLFPLDLYRACSSHHAVILCEGSTLKSTFANALTLFLCEAAGIMAAQGKPCIAYGAEVGKMEPFLKRAAVRLCRRTFFIARTESSLTALKELGLPGTRGTDAAWHYDYTVDTKMIRTRAQALLHEKGWDGQKPLLGIAVIDPFCWPVRSSVIRWLRSILTGNRTDQYDKWYFFSVSAERKAAYRKYLREIAKGINHFMQKQDCFPVLIGMERLDEKACHDLSGMLRRKAALVLSGDTSADTMTGLLRSLSVLVTSRYHAAVLSVAEGCPITAVSMDERLDGIMGELSFTDRFLHHVTDENLGKEICRSLSGALRDQAAIRDHIISRHRSYMKQQDQMGSLLKKYLTDTLKLQF